VKKTYLKYWLANGGGGEPFGSKPVVMYMPHTYSLPLDEYVENIANTRFSQELPQPLHIYKVDVVELSEEEIERLNANPLHIIDN